MTYLGDEFKTKSNFFFLKKKGVLASRKTYIEKFTGKSLKLAKETV